MPKKTVGLITVEDILEELVGEIFDEDDSVDQDFQPLGGNKYAVNTHMLIGSVYERMGLDKIPHDLAAKPIISFILESLGHFPQEDETFVCDNLEFTVKSVKANSVSQVIIHILEPDSAPAPQAVPETEEAQV